MLIDHRRAPLRQPQTNGGVERCNGRIAEVIEPTRFTCAAEMSWQCTHGPPPLNRSAPCGGIGRGRRGGVGKAWGKADPVPRGSGIPALSATCQADLFNSPCEMDKNG